MKFIHHADDRRLYTAIGLVTLAACAAVVLACLFSVSYANRAARDSYASILATVAQKYPQAEADVVRDLRAGQAASPAAGYAILKKYGLEQSGVPDTRVPAALLARILPAGLILTLLACAAYTFLLVRYQQRVAGQIEGLSRYIRQIDAGDYSLDIRDNGEGSLSLLKNDLYKITVRLREQAERLQLEKAHLSDAIADISHQIKTPLTSLFVLADLLAGDPPEDKRREFLDRLGAQLGRIQWLVSALLKLSRLDAGTAELKREPVAVARLVERAVEALKIPLEIKKQSVEVHGEPDVRFSGDFNWSLEALTNLVKNCVEHTPEGGRIEIQYGANALYTEIVVADDGEGIAKEDLPHIFNRFYRGRNAGDNSIGIGLALAKAIFEAQGGDLSVKSEPGHGARFEAKLFRAVS